MRSAKAGRTPHTEPEDVDEEEDDCCSALLSGVVSGAEGRRETADDSMMALMAKALPIWRWQSVQWQVWTRRGGRLIW